MLATELSDAAWRKSSYSGGDSGGGECVEVAGITGCTAVRDSKDPNGPVLVFPAASWAAFVADVKAGHVV
ncbi:MAG: DUF397 domain-containing protein [Streptomyces sp.]|nr:DUF397 domain-containing protein [Streptomyces sp.]